MYGDAAKAVMIHVFKNNNKINFMFCFTGSCLVKNKAVMKTGIKKMQTC